MYKVFHGRTADEAWRRVATAFSEGTHVAEQESRAGRTYEILHAAISIDRIRQRWVASRRPPINIAFAIAEVVWILRGRSDSRFLNFFNRSLPRYAGSGPSYCGAYGYRLRQHLGFDQLDRAYSALSKRPSSRQVVLQIWDGRVDMPDANGGESSPDVPCNVVSLLKVRGGTLEWTQVMRSSDVFRGQPYNFIQFTTLQEVVAGWLGLEPGDYHQITDSLHVYADCLEYIKATKETSISENTDCLMLSKSESEAVVREVAAKVDDMIRPEFPIGGFVSTAERSSVPRAYKNLLCILLAEGARRRGAFEGMWEVLEMCNNRGLREMYEMWLGRVQGRALS